MDEYIHSAEYWWEPLLHRSSSCHLDCPFKNRCRSFRFPPRCAVSLVSNRGHNACNHNNKGQGYDLFSMRTVKRRQVSAQTRWKSAWAKSVKLTQTSTHTCCGEFVGSDERPSLVKQQSPTNNSCSIAHKTNNKGWALWTALSGN